MTFPGTTIVGVDGSEHSRDALSLAAALSGPDGRLLAAYVHPYGELSSLLEAGDYEQLVRETAESIFEDVRELVGDAIRSELRLVSDRSPAKGLQTLATDERADVIIVGSSSRSRLERVLAGSVAEGLLSGAPAPVALAPQGYARRSGASWNIIGCGFDGSDEARAALGLAEKLAAELRAGVRVLGVNQALAFGGVSSTGAFAYESANESLRDALQQRLEDAASGLDERVRGSAEVLDGSPAAMLIEQSEQLDLLIVGSRGYGPVRSVVLGSVSRALAREAACPVIVVPRPGEAS